MADATASEALKGRVALVTGASSGLGRQFALTLARSGASVVAAARRLEALETLVEQIRSQGGQATACALDVCDSDAIVRAFKTAEAEFGLVDILVNNAAASDANYAVRLPLDLIDRVINTNFRAPFLLSVEMARRLIAAKTPGRIVNIASTAAFATGPKTATSLYGGSKAGLVRLTESLALEWAEFGINVNAIAPGMFRSEMTGAYIERAGDEVARGFPRRRFGEPEDLDSTLLYLVSPGSHFVTGTCIIVDDAQSFR